MEIVEQEESAIESTEHKKRESMEEMVQSGKSHSYERTGDWRGMRCTWKI